MVHSIVCMFGNSWLSCCFGILGVLQLAEEGASIDYHGWRRRVFTIGTIFPTNLALNRPSVH
jgi:hypothetical protein